MDETVAAQVFFDEVWVGSGVREEVESVSLLILLFFIITEEE